MKYYFTTIARSLIIITICLFLTKASSAQETGISPYSRIGLGDINRSHSPAYGGLGGASLALSDFNFINISNPASYSSLMEHMPVFEIDGASQLLNLKSTSGSGSVGVTTFTRMSVGIPLSKRLGMSLGLLPFTTTGYDVSTTNSEPNVGDVQYDYNGKGGINRAYIGAGYSIIDKDSINLSFGFNYSFLFGNIEKTRRVEFPDDATALNSMLYQKTNHNGSNFELGLLYKQRITENFSYSLGASFSTGVVLKANREELSATYTNSASFEIIRDTLSYFSDNMGEINIPLAFKFGGAIKLNGNTDISVQYESQDWTSYDEKFNPTSAKDSLSASSRVLFGIRYTPSEVVSTANYLERIEYRAGFRYEKLPLQFNNTQITEFGTSFGLGLPIRAKATSKNEFKSVSMINLGVDFGKRGTTENGLIEEKFTRIYFGISIMPQPRNRWFVKRKFD